MSQGQASQGHHSNHGRDQEPTPFEVAQYQNDDNFKRMMNHFLKEDREAYFLELAQQGAKLPSNFNVKDIIMQEEETPVTMIIKLMKCLTKYKRCSQREFGFFSLISL